MPSLKSSLKAGIKQLSLNKLQPKYIEVNAFFHF